MTRANLLALNIAQLAALRSPGRAMRHALRNMLRGGLDLRLTAPLPGSDTPAPNASEVLP